jgi:MoxR-like ATPase
MNVQEIVDSVSTVLKGKEEVVLRSLVCFLSGGHLLLEDVPGVGKTTLALSLSSVLGLFLCPHPIYQRPFTLRHIGSEHL